jgi:hypothetical protein
VSGAALDVGEKEGDGSGREIGSHSEMMSQDVTWVGEEPDRYATRIVSGSAHLWLIGY